MSNAKFDLIPIGGLGEVGMNNMLFRSEGHSFLLDCGTASSHSPWLGFDSIFPDYKKIFVDDLHWPDEVLITHGHEDHIGALPYFIRQCPKEVVNIHATKFSSDLIQRKLQEHGLQSRVNILVHEQGEEFDLGPWTISYFFNNHSIYDSNCLKLQLGDFVVFHTGDFRIDQEQYKDPIFDISKIKESVGKVDLLLSDSTNAERPGWSLGESAIGDNFLDIMKETEGAVVFTCFASNVRRLQHIIESAKMAGRKIAVAGRSMEKFFDLSQKYDIFQIASKDRVLWEDLGSAARSDLVLLLTGSQGEFQAALSRMVHDQMRGFGMEKGDSLVYSALQIPGNESRVRYLLNKCVSKGIEIYKNSPDRILHTTGHANKEELLSVISEIKPKYFVPVHGDLTMLKAHSEIAQEVDGIEETFVIEDLKGICFSSSSKPETFSMGEQPPLAWSKWEYFGQVDDQAIKEKKKIGSDGMIFFTFDESSLFEDKIKSKFSFVGCHYLDAVDLDSKLVSEKMFKSFFASYNAKDDLVEWFRVWIRIYIKKRYRMKPLIRIEMI